MLYKLILIHVWKSHQKQPGHGTLGWGQGRDWAQLGLNGPGGIFQLK